MQAERRIAIDPRPVPREEQLLLFCAGLVVEAESVVQIKRLIRQGINWDCFLDRAMHHRVVPLVWHTVSKNCHGAFPVGVTRELQTQASVIARRSLFLTAELIKLLQFFRDQKIRAIAYKGPTAALLAYGSLSLRQFSDLDVLVHPRDYAEAREQLLARGYLTTADWGWECSLRGPSGLVSVDLHQSVAPEGFSVGLDFDLLWSRLETLPVGAGALRTLCPEDMLMVLCIQLIKDSWGEGVVRLSKVCDIAELLRRHSGLKWNDVLEQAKELGCSRMLWVCLAIVQDVLGASTSGPTPVIPNRSSLRALQDHVSSRLFDEQSLTSDRRLSRDDFHFKVRERWKDKLYPKYVRFKQLLAPNERDFAVVSLPENLRWVYYLLKPGRLAKESLEGLFRKLP